eukprot:1294101-Prymnesium_polylepis.1
MLLALEEADRLKPIRCQAWQAGRGCRSRSLTFALSSCTAPLATPLSRLLQIVALPHTGLTAGRAAGFVEVRRAQLLDLAATRTHGLVEPWLLLDAKPQQRAQPVLERRQPHVAKPESPVRRVALERLVEDDLVDRVVWRRDYSMRRVAVRNVDVDCRSEDQTRRRLATGETVELSDAHIDAARYRRIVQVGDSFED